jgi:large subunit ribosomal protein L9
MATELILVKNVKDLGKVGEIVKVADGYARNFLLPRGYAQPVTKSALRQVEAIKIKLQKEYEENVKIAEALAAKIGEASIIITAEANEDDKLFGSVTARMIAEEVKAQTGIEVETSAIMLKDAIRTVGEFTVGVTLLPEVTTELKVTITKPETATEEVAETAE